MAAGNYQQPGPTSCSSANSPVFKRVHPNYFTVDLKQLIKRGVFIDKEKLDTAEYHEWDTAVFLPEFTLEEVSSVEINEEPTVAGVVSREQSVSQNSDDEGNEQRDNDDLPPSEDPKALSTKERRKGHQISKKISCAACGRKVVDKKSPPDNRKKRSTSKGVVCERKGCEKRFSDKYGMKDHVKSFHFGQKFRCTYCTAVYSYRAGLTKHLRIFHDKPVVRRKKTFKALDSSKQT